MKKVLFYPLIFLLCLFVLTSCATWQRVFTSYETFEVGYEDALLEVKMPSEVPTEYIEKDASLPFFIGGRFVGVRYAFDEAHVYDFIDFVLSYENKELKVYGVVCWSASNLPPTKGWIYINGLPINSTLKEIVEIIQRE